MVQEAQGTEKPCRAPRNEFFLGRDSWNEQYYSLRSYKWGYNFSWHHTIFCATPTVLQHFCVTDSQTAIQDLLFRDICFRILALETDSKNPKNRADDRKKKSRQPQRTKNQFFLNSSVAQHPMACVHRPPKNFGGQPPHRSQFCFFFAPETVFSTLSTLKFLRGGSQFILTTLIFRHSKKFEHLPFAGSGYSR